MALKATLLLFFSLLISPQTKADTQLIGLWKFVAMRYQGQEIPPINPDLLLYFEFEDTALDRLYWTRKGETGFCERKAQYRAEAGILKELVVWVNPNNANECSKDPDMQMGRETVFPYHVVGGRLEMDLPLGDEKLVYIWEKQIVPPSN